MADNQTNPQTQDLENTQIDLSATPVEEAAMESVELPEINLDATPVENTVAENTDGVAEPTVATMEEIKLDQTEQVQNAPVEFLTSTEIPAETSNEVSTQAENNTDSSEGDNLATEQISTTTPVEQTTQEEIISEPSAVAASEEANIQTDPQPSPELTAETEIPNQITPEDPFDGLNIVFDPPAPATETQNLETQSSLDQIISNTAETATTETTTAQATTENKAFIDPFLGKPETQEVVTETTNQASLDTMLEGLDTTTATVVSEPKTGGLDAKKKKMLLVGSGVLGILVLAGASYMVFTTMFPSGTEEIKNQLQGDITGPATGTVETGANNTDTTNNEEIIAWGANDEYVPGGNTTDEEELTNPEPADSFGSEDELPAGTVIPETPDTSTTTGSADEEELTANVTPEVDQALKTLDEQVDKLKQLLALAKAKNDPAIIKQIALTLKSIRAVKEKIVTNTFTSFSTEIEPTMSEINFEVDKLTASLVQ